MEGFDLVAFIKDFGFPIAACVALFIMLMKSVRELKDAIYELKTSFIQSSNEQKAELTQAINNNTVALTRLTDKIGDG